MMLLVLVAFIRNNGSLRHFQDANVDDHLATNQAPAHAREKDEAYCSGFIYIYIYAQ